MQHGLGSWFSERGTGLGTVFANRSLRRLCLALLASETSTPAFGVALYVFAYQRGGPGAVGFAALVTMLPAAVAAPFAALVADRARRERVVTAALLARALLLAAAAAGAIVGLPMAIVYSAASLASIAARVLFPARIALVPALTGSEQELAAANAVMSTIENVGFVAGPAVAGAALAVANPPIVFALAACATLAAAGIAAGIHAEPRACAAARRAPVRQELVAGFRVIAVDPTLRLVIGIYTAETAAFGLLMVLVVGLAVDVLRVGEAGVGALNCALGAGGIAGGVVALVLARRSRGGADLIVGSLLLGFPLAVLAFWPQAMLAAVLLAAAGAGGVVVDVACYTQLQQAAADEVRARVFGVLEGLAVGAVGLGSALGGVTAASIGVRPAFLVAATVPILGALAATRIERRSDSAAAPPSMAAVTAASEARA